MKIFKLSKAEMQKIFARPGIFIVAFLFILTIVASSFIYNLPSRYNGIVSIPGNNVQAIYNHYNGGSAVVVDSREYYNAQLDSIVTQINGYANPSTPIQDLTNAFEIMRDIYSNYSVYIKYSAFDDELIDQTKHQLKASITSFKNIYLTLYNESYSKMLVTQKNHTFLLQFLSMCEDTIPNNDDADNLVILTNLNALNFLNVIKSKIEAIELYEVSYNIIFLLNDTYLQEVNARLLDIDAEITQFFNNNTLSNSPLHLKEIRRLISNYKLTIEQFGVIAFNTINVTVFEGFSNEKIKQFLGFSDLNMYEQKENLSRNIFLFQNNKFAYEYANAFSVVNPSNTSVNAFDFAYFTLELFSFIIIIYVVVLGAGMIAGEEANGTMKLLAMRPFKRYKIFLGKIFAALRVGLIFIIIGAVASFITGTYIYGATSLPVLSVFNMEYIIIASPYIMFAIYLFTLFIEVLFYTIIAVCISSIFKSYTGAVTISILIYFMSMILAFVTGASWLKFVPLTHTNLFKYFGGAFAGDTAVAGLNSLLTPPILLDSNFMFSVGALSITITILLIVALKIFSKRDLK